MPTANHPASANLRALRFTVWLGLAMCGFDLIASEATIFEGGAHIESTAPIVMLVEPLAHALGGVDWHARIMQVYAGLWLAHYLVFMAAFWLCNRDGQNRPYRTAFLLALQALAALAGDGQLELGVAAQIAFYYRLPQAMIPMAALIAAYAVGDLPFFFGRTGFPPVDNIYIGNFLAYQLRDILVASGMGYIARAAWHSRARLIDANEELRAAERKLADAERDAERMRIARDLHDKVGHQLTAINLHLELGMRRAGAEIPAAIRSARELAGAVLAKLRVAVGREAGTAEEPVLPPVAALNERGRRQIEIFAWAGVAACLYALVWDQAMLWIGKRQVLTFDVIFLVCKWLVARVLPSGAALEPTLHLVYSCSWIFYYCAFAAAFWAAATARNTGGEHSDNPSRKLLLLWWAQIVLAVVWHGQYLYAVLPQVAYRLPLRRALIWFGIVLAASAVVLAPFLMGWMGFPAASAISAWYFPLKVVRDEAAFFVAGLLARAAMQQRARLAQTHADLRAAQQRLAEAARVAERLRITNDLHEVLGHDLAAMNLQLDLGLRQSGSQLAESVGVAHQAGRQLFDNIRVAIEQDKLGQQGDLAAALHALCAGVPQPRVHLSVSNLGQVDAELAHDLVCCVHEGITNAVRHAGASSLAVSVTRNEEGVLLQMRDDGAGLQGAAEGNGLRGMRERVAQHGGSMRLLPGSGCGIDIFIPALRADNNQKKRVNA